MGVRMITSISVRRQLCLPLNSSTRTNARQGCLNFQPLSSITRFSSSSCISHSSEARRQSSGRLLAVFTVYVRCAFKSLPNKQLQSFCAFKPNHEPNLLCLLSQVWSCILITEHLGVTRCLQRHQQPHHHHHGTSTSSPLLPQSTSWAAHGENKCSECRQVIQRSWPSQDVHGNENQNGESLIV